MTRAYDNVYIERARCTLGQMLEFAVNTLGYDIDIFFSLFLTSGTAKKFGDGDYSLLVGLSGTELAYRVLELSGMEYEKVCPVYTTERSPEFWLGWALAYFQWESGLSFEDIAEKIPIHNVLKLYSPYHEMDIRHFRDKMNELYLGGKTETNLKAARLRLGITQKELAEESGVPLRTIQQYEQGAKSINKAQAEYLVRLARVLCCRVEDLLEYLGGRDG